MLTTHGHTRGPAKGRKPSPTFVSWWGMLERCNNPRNKRYADYGGRGIKVCEHWSKFESFLSDMGVRPEGKTLDRYPNNNGDYEHGNCRWATASEQQRNRRQRRPSRATHCPKGHPYSGDNLRIEPRNGHRRCRACAKADKAARRSRNA